MSKFTPGTWIYRESSREIGVMDESDTQSYGMIMVVAYVDEYDHKEYRENAHLIAAAPDLYEALQSIISNSTIQANHPTECEHAEKILAKARGEL